MILKSAYEIASERYGKTPSKPRETVDNAIVVEKSPMLLDTESPYENEHKEFFSTNYPSKVCGSRAIDIADKKAALEGVKLRKVSGISVHYEGPMLSHSGYSTMNRAIIDGLCKAGVEVKTNITTTQIDVSDEIADRFKGLESTDIPDDSPKISGLTVPQNSGHSGRKILYTMMETSKEVHPDYVGKLNLTNEVWVPNSYLVDILMKSGVHSEVFEMPLGVDTSLYSPKAKPMDLGMDVRKFVFLSVFNWGFRKGWDLLLKAYLEEFSSEDDVTLVMSVKTLGNPKGVSDIVSQISNFKLGIKKHHSKLPHMLLHTGEVDDQHMPGLYTAADAFILMSRGEGMGLPYIEAGACGLPVIATNVTAQSTFLNDDNSYLVEPDEYTRHNITDSSFGNMSRLCRFYEGQYFPKFGSTAINRARSCMREVFEGLGEANKKGEILRKDICENLTWNHAVNRITSRLEEIT